jgi:hypothetical protein
MVELRALIVFVFTFVSVFSPAHAGGFRPMPKYNLGKRYEQERLAHQQKQQMLAQSEKYWRTVVPHPDPDEKGKYLEVDIPKATPAEMQKASPASLREIMTQVATMNTPKPVTLEQFKQVYTRVFTHFPVEAVQFYTVIGAIAIIECTLMFSSRPSACNDFLNSHLMASTHLSFLAFTGAAAGMGLGGQAINYGLHKVGSRFIVPPFVWGQLGMVAGSIVSDLGTRVWSSKSLWKIRAINKRISSGAELSKEDLIEYEKAQDEAYKEWITPDGWAHMKSTTVILLSSAAASALTSKTISKIFYQKTSEKALTQAGIVDKVVLRKFGAKIGIGPLARALSKPAFSTVSAISFGTTGLFMAWDWVLRPPIQRAMDQQTLEVATKLAEQDLVKDLGRSFILEDGTTDTDKSKKFDYIKSLINGWVFKENRSTTDSSQWTVYSQIDRHRMSTARIQQQRNGGALTRGYDLSMQWPDEHGKRIPIGESLLKKIEEYSGLMHQMREHHIGKFREVQQSWNSFLAVFNSEIVSTIRFYNNFISSRPKMDFKGKNGIFTSALTDAITVGIHSWSTGFEMDSADLFYQVKAKKYGISWIVLVNESYMTLQDISRSLEKMDDFDRALRVEALNRRIRWMDIAGKDRIAIQNLINSSKEQNPAALEGTNPFLQTIGEEVAFVNEVRNGQGPFPMIGSFIYHNTAEKMMPQWLADQIQSR